MPQYMLLLHERPAAYASVTPAEMKEIVDRYKAWAEQLDGRGKRGTDALNEYTKLIAATPAK